MSTHHTTATPARRTMAALAAAGAGLALATAPVSAAPPGEVPLGVFHCSDGTTIAPVGKTVPGFMHTAVGFLDGRAVAPRWFTGQESGTLTITNGEFAGDEVPFNVTWSEAPNGRRAAAPNLTALVGCASDPAPNMFSLTLDQDAIDYTGIDSRYLGADADVDSTLVVSVHLGANQLAHR